MAIGRSLGHVGHRFIGEGQRGHREVASSVAIEQRGHRVVAW